MASFHRCTGCEQLEIARGAMPANNRGMYTVLVPFDPEVDDQMETPEP